MKKLLCLVLAIAVFLSVTVLPSVSGFAQECQLGDSDTYYQYDDATRTLVITGTGDMPNFANFDKTVPWYDISQDIDKVVISEGITSISNYSFYSVSAKEFVLPSTLNRIGRLSLAYVDNVTNWDLPYGLKTIDAQGFYGSAGFETIDIPTTVTSLGERAFQGCHSLKSIVIPYSVNSIGDYCFAYCTALNSVRFQSMTSSVSIGSYAFFLCRELKRIDVPLNASCAIHFFGYEDWTSKYSGITMGVYGLSNAFNYAYANDISYVLLDAIPVECATENYNTYTEENIKDEYHYTFVADTTGDYCFYTTGQVDTKCEVKHNGKTIAANDDVSTSNRNFSVQISCTKGETYDIFVQSYISVGTYSFVVLPCDIKSITISGSYNLSAEDGYYDWDGEFIYSLDTSMLEGSFFTVEYANGVIHRFDYSSRFYDGTYITMGDDGTVSSLHCGKNLVPVSIRNGVGCFDMYVEHTYVESTVNPTPYSPGYILHKCVGCDESFKDNYFTVDKKVYTISGTCVLSQDKFGGHSENVPFSSAKIYANNEVHDINPDGTWEIKTYSSCTIRFANPYGNDYVYKYTISPTNPNKVYGAVVLDGYDINNDGYVNARDYAIYKKELVSELGNDYWQFATNFYTMR